SLQQDYTFTVTPDLGSCECNSQFFDALSSCLGCISSQGKNSPAIDTQINWANQCKDYGFNMTALPIPYTPPIKGGSGVGSNSGGLGGGAIAGIVIGLLVVAGAGAFFFVRTRKRRTKGSVFARPYTAANDSGSYEPTNNQAGFNTYNNYQHDEYPDNHTTGGGYSDYEQNYYGSGQNDDDSMAMSNLQHSNYIPPPVPMSPSAVAAVAAVGQHRPLGEPRPSDQFPQSLRVKAANKEWDGPQQHRQNELTSDLISNDQLLVGSGYNSPDESSPAEGGQSESPESARRRRAAELFSAEGSRR
ncbi:hypothetical protein BGX23_001698, partial [Mortierella sp. AD031]